MCVCVCARVFRIQTRSTCISLPPRCFTDTKVSCRMCVCARASRIQSRTTSISLIPHCFTDTKVSCRIGPLSTDTKVEQRRVVGVRMKNSIRNRNRTGGARTEATRDMATSQKHAHRLNFFSRRMLNRECERARQRRLSRVLKLSEVFTF